MGFPNCERVRRRQENEGPGDGDGDGDGEETAVNGFGHGEPEEPICTFPFEGEEVAHRRLIVHGEPKPSSSPIVSDPPSETILPGLVHGARPDEKLTPRIEGKGIQATSRAN